MEEQNEQKKASQEAEAKPSTEDTGREVQQDTLSELDRADQIAERLKRENDRREELIKRDEALEARRAVGGRTQAGVPPPKEKEVDDKEYAQKALAGELNKEDDTKN